MVGGVSQGRVGGPVPSPSYPPPNSPTCLDHPKLHRANRSKEPGMHRGLDTKLGGGRTGKESNQGAGKDMEGGKKGI